MLLIWQIVEIVVLCLSIPVVLLFGILFTGDSYTVFNAVSSYVIPVLLVILAIKLVMIIAMFKRKRWAAFVNAIQNIVLGLLMLLLSVKMVFLSSNTDSIISFSEYYPTFLIALFLILLSVGFFNAARSPYFRKNKPELESMV